MTGPATSAMVAVLDAGTFTTIQDLGRPGLAHLGVPRSGAADRDSLRLANRLVGNREDSACLETTLTGPRLKLDGACTLALAGATVNATLNGRPLAMNSPVHAESGATLTVGPASAGLRTYIAFRGGIACEPVLGSRSTDSRSGIGPPPLTGGDRLPIGVPTGAFPDVDHAPVQPPPEHPAVTVVPGPRAEFFTDSAWRTLLAVGFTVSTDSSRVGVRLDGPVLERRDQTELRSEGMAHGSIQVPPDGHPLILLADHPTTGGYPVIAVVHSAALSLIGQLRPGQLIGFRAPGSARKPA